MGEHLGLTEGVSMALGGMIGGGIFAVLGVVAQITGAATWFAFVTAGVVAACAGYSYNRLNELSADGGGSVTFVQCFTGNTTAAGMVGWTLLFGYVGSMAMYAYAFGSFAVGLAPVPETLVGLPMRVPVSVLAVAGFVGLNLLGARATGSTENLLVAAKVLILLVFGVWGLYYGFTHAALEFGIDNLTTPSFGPVMAAAVSFVAFQGWQLLFYDQESVADPVETIRTAVYVSIPAAVAIYVVVAITTTSLAPGSIIQQHPERALAVAARPFMGEIGFTLISVAALFSTGSAINATLFSSGHFAKGMLSDDLLPDRIGDGDADGLPERTVVGLGAVTAMFAAVGSLQAITSFASLAFILVFGSMSTLAFRQREDLVSAAVPAVGAVGAGLFLPLMLWHLYQREFHTFVAVLLLAVVVVTAELLYFEHETLAEEVQQVGDEIPTTIADG